MVIFNLNNRITVQNIWQKTENQPKSKQKSSTKVPTHYFIIVRKVSPAYDFKEQCTRKCKLRTVNRILQASKGILIIYLHHNSSSAKSHLLSVHLAPCFNKRKIHFLKLIFHFGFFSVLKTPWWSIFSTRIIE